MYNPVVRASSLVLGAVFVLSAFVMGPLLLTYTNDLYNFPVISNLFIKLFGLVLISSCLILISICSGIFVKFGKGTPVPIEPPKNLVTSKIYSYTRNPIYIGYFGILLGEFLVFGFLLLLLYFVSAVVFINLFVIFYEEPRLKARFGESYLEYLRRVPRWL